MWDGSPALQALPSELHIPDLVNAHYHEEDGSHSLSPKQAHRVVVKSIDLELPMGVTVKVNRYAQHVDVMITMPPQIGGQDGHCGNYNAVADDDTQQHLLERMGSTVSLRDSLFGTQSAPAETPTGKVTLDDCPQELKQKAMELCDNVSADNLRDVFAERCVFDVCFGGKDFAEASATMGLQAHQAQAESMIRPVLHDDMCFDVGGGQPLNGSVLQLWTCVEGHPDMMFLLPAGSQGQIRWAAYPHMCLDIDGRIIRNGARVQWWECQVGHRDMQFLLPESGHGKIRWAANPEFCLDIVDVSGEVGVGREIQVWACAEGAQNQEFSWQ